MRPPLLKGVIRFLLGTAVFASAGWVFASEQDPVYEINFDDRSPDFITYREIERWARNHQLAAVPDSRARNLEDGLAVTIPPHGMKFTLDVPGNGRAYLYLDLVTYVPLSDDANSNRVYWLEVLVNGKVLATLHIGAGRYPMTPVRLLLEREHAMDRIARIELRPTPGSSYLAIWDAFVSANRE